MNGLMTGRLLRERLAPGRLAGILGILLLLSGSASHAAPCAGFTDVEDTDPFCSSVDWLKNRSVTLGCTSATLYCPVAAVSRLAMAAFMNRLGVALTPQIPYQEASGPSLDLDSPPATVCATAAQAIADFPRFAGAGAVFSAQVGATAANVDLRLMQSVNGGAWTPISSQPSSTGGASKWINAAVHTIAVPLAVGNTYAFGLAATRSALPGSTGDLLTWRCQLQVVIHSRTGGSAPF
jgi:hypothetical protein